MAGQGFFAARNLDGEASVKPQLALLPTADFCMGLWVSNRSVIRFTSLLPRKEKRRMFCITLFVLAGILIQVDLVFNFLMLFLAIVFFFYFHLTTGVEFYKISFYLNNHTIL